MPLHPLHEKKKSKNIALFLIIMGIVVLFFYLGFKKYGLPV